MLHGLLTVVGGHDHHGNALFHDRLSSFSLDGILYSGTRWISSATGEHDLHPTDLVEPDRIDGVCQLMTVLLASVLQRKVSVHDLASVDVDFLVLVSGQLQTWI